MQPGFPASTSTKSNSLLAWQRIQRAFSMSIPSSLSSGSNLKALNESVTPPSSVSILPIDSNRYNLKLGDVMSIDGDVYPGRWEFVVRGIYQPRDQTTNPASMMFHHKYIDERVRQEAPHRAGDIGWYIVRIANPDDSASVSEAIDNLFANSRAETKTETEKVFQQSFLSAASAIITAMNIISFVIIGIILLVLSNTMIMSVRERTHEYAVLKALCFTGPSLFFLMPASQ